VVHSTRVADAAEPDAESSDVDNKPSSDGTYHYRYCYCKFVIGMINMVSDVTKLEKICRMRMRIEACILSIGT